MRHINAKSEIKHLEVLGDDIRAKFDAFTLWVRVEVFEAKSLALPSIHLLVHASYDSIDSQVVGGLVKTVECSTDKSVVWTDNVLLTAWTNAEVSSNRRISFAEDTFDVLFNLLVAWVAPVMEKQMRVWIVEWVPYLFVVRHFSTMIQLKSLNSVRFGGNKLLDVMMPE